MWPAAQNVVTAAPHAVWGGGFRVRRRWKLGNERLRGGRGKVRGKGSLFGGGVRSINIHPADRGQKCMFI